MPTRRSRAEPGGRSTKTKKKIKDNDQAWARLEPLAARPLQTCQNPASLEHPWKGFWRLDRTAIAPTDRIPAAGPGCPGQVGEGANSSGQVSPVGAGQQNRSSPAGLGRLAASDRWPSSMAAPVCLGGLSGEARQCVMAGQQGAVPCCVGHVGRRGAVSRAATGPSRHEDQSPEPEALATR